MTEGTRRMTNEFLLQDRLQKIRQIIRKYGEENFYISFSGGKDSTVLSALVDMAIGSQNQIPRVFCNTGIELVMIRDYVFELARSDERVQIIAPTLSIKKTLEKYGYPFKSKKHAKKLGTYQRHGMTKTALTYLNPSAKNKTFACPEMLKYQFSPDFHLKVDYQCCVKMKEEPLRKW